jgi:putative CocE/NonD family hydrolase
VFLYDPADPPRPWLGRNIWAAADELDDRRPLEARQDVLVYTSPPLAEDLEVTGPVEVVLFAASSAPDTDFTAALVDVFADGYAQLVWDGIIRARYRGSEREPELIEPGRPYEYVISLGPVSYLFPRAHRLRLEVSSADFDRHDRNLNTGAAFGGDARLQVARQTVLHDTEHPSRIVLPVFLCDA